MLPSSAWTSRKALWKRKNGKMPRQAPITAKKAGPIRQCNCKSMPDLHQKILFFSVLKVAFCHGAEKSQQLELLIFFLKKSAWFKSG